MGDPKTFPIVPAARWQRIEEVFLDALALDPRERAGFVATACGGDDGLRAEIAALLASADEAPSYVGDIVANSLGAFETVLLVDRQLGPYRLISLIGEGGMGAVYLAERSDAEFRRHVAVKVLRDGLTSRDAIARFRDERQILADLDHPGIVRLIDGGTSDGMPYLVMENVDGAPITAHAEGLPLRDRIALVRPACAALAYAHARHIVHRDIKPSNILVTRDGVVKLVDFGIAKLLHATEREAHTRTGALLLTPEYASPEQACGDPVTPATDVYSLGAVLYHLLTGRPPLELRGGALAIVNAICEEEPRFPSTVAPGTPRELDLIVMKALRKEPAERYASIEALDRDLERFLDGRPISAGPPSWLRFARRSWTKRRLAFGAIVVVAIAAVAIALRPAPPARTRSEMQRLTQRLGTVSRARFAPDGSIVYGWGSPHAVYRMTPGEPERVVAPNADLLAVSSSGELAMLLDAKVTGVTDIATMTRTGRLVRADARGQAPRALATDVISADWTGDQLAITRYIPGISTNNTGARGLVEWPIGNVVYETPGRHLDAIRVSPDGKRIAFLEGAPLQQLVVVDHAKHVTKIGTDHDIAGIAWSKDGELWVADTPTAGDRCVSTIALDGSRHLVQCSTGTLTLHDLDAAGRALVTSDRVDGRILLKAPGSREEREVQTQTTDVLYDVTPDGKRIVFGTGQYDGPLYIRDIDGPPVRIGTGRGVAISPDGAWVASSDRAHHYLVPTSVGTPIDRTPPPGVKNVIGSFGGWSPDSKLLYSGCGTDGRHSTCTFTVDGRSTLVIRGKRPASSTHLRSFSPDGKWFIATDGVRTLELASTDGSSAHPLPDTPAVRNLGHQGFGDAVGWSADGKSVFLVGTGRPSKRLDIDRLDLETGLATPWQSLGPEAVDFTGVIVFAGGEGYAYSYQRRLSDLYMMR